MNVCCTVEEGEVYVEGREVAEGYKYSPMNEANYIT